MNVFRFCQNLFETVLLIIIGSEDNKEKSSTGKEMRDFLTILLHFTKKSPLCKNILNTPLCIPVYDVNLFAHLKAVET